MPSHDVVLTYALTMAKSEGVRRIMMVGKVIVLIGVTLGVLAGLLFFGSPGILLGGTIAMYVAAFGALVWAAGWVIQGFTQPDP